jgi:hypothetical protein
MIPGVEGSTLAEIDQIRIQQHLTVGVGGLPDDGQGYPGGVTGRIGRRIPT